MCSYMIKKIKEMLAKSKHKREKKRKKTKTIDVSFIAECYAVRGWVKNRIPVPK